MAIGFIGAFDNGERSWNEMIDSPWMGLYKINDDEFVIVHEEFMSDTDPQASFAQFHATGSESEPDKIIEHRNSISPEEMPDLSAFESDDDDMPSIIGKYTYALHVFIKA